MGLENLGQLKETDTALEAFKLDLDDNNFRDSARTIQHAQNIISKCGQTFGKTINELVDLALLKLPADMPDAQKEAIKQVKKVDYAIQLLVMCATEEERG